jgi:predicted RNase H-like nuclease (RuvC/YqgF family)
MRNQRIKTLKIKSTSQKMNEELSRLRDHNQSLLTQIKKLKNDKKSLQNKLEQLTIRVVIPSYNSTILLNA